MAIRQQIPERCRAVKKNGQPCMAAPRYDGLCLAHSGRAAEWQRKGGQRSKRSARLDRLMPDRLRWVVDILEETLRELHGGDCDVGQARAKAAVAVALTKVFATAELEQRMLAVEAAIKRHDQDQEQR
jgi:hypothetical protein